MSPLGYHPGDEQLVHQILEQTAVATKPSRPALTGYIATWTELLARWIDAFLAERSGLAGGILKTTLIIVLAGLALAVFLLVASVVRRLRNRDPRDAAARLPGWTEVPEGGPAPRDRVAWKIEIEARLSRGDVAGALEALWWWFAASLPLETGIDSSWTTRQLLLQANRHELLGLGSMLDALMYGPRSPSPEDVSGCLARFEARLP